MKLEEFSRVVQDLGGASFGGGDGEVMVEGIAVEEPVEGWLGEGEAVITGRGNLGAELLKELGEAGAPAVVWRTREEPDAGIVDLASSLGVRLFTLSPKIPLRRVLSAFAVPEDLLLHSHRVGRALLESLDASSVGALVARISELLGCEIVLEDTVGRAIAEGSPTGEESALAARLEENGLTATRGYEIDETHRERRDRYARLPDGFLSVPVERWRVGKEEFFWMPVGGRIPTGYLWLDLGERPIQPEDVVVLYWGRRLMEIEMGKERVRLETEMGVRGEFVEDLITGHYGSVELLLQRAKYLGADLSGGATAMIVDIDDFARYLRRRKLEEPTIQELKRRLADAVCLQARDSFSNFLTGPRSDNVILFAAPSGGIEGEELSQEARRLAARIQSYVKGLLPDLTVSIGIGRHIQDPTLLPDAYSEAEVALEIGHRIHGPSSVSTFEEAGTYKLLFRILQENPQELETFYRETLEPVAAYDSRYGTELIHTLVTYLHNDTSTARTASQLFAHRHTVRYRLDRVRELTSLDVEKSEDREHLTLGIKAMQLLGRTPERPPSITDR